MMKPVPFKHVLMLVLLVAMFAAGCRKNAELLPDELSDSSSVELSATAVEPEAAAVAGEMIVKFRSDLSEEKRVTLLGKVRGVNSKKILTRTMAVSGDGDGLLLIKTSGDVKSAIATLKESGGVEYAEPNYIMKHDAVSNDPFFSGNYLWGMYGDATSPLNVFGSQAGEAWAKNHTGSKSIFVGIIDEGVMVNHEDLAANIWTNPFEQLDGIDNDGNGYVDDIHGWDFDANNSSVFDGSMDDHGTHVAGTIGAQGGNAKGVAGLNWNVTMIVAKFLGDNGGTLANAIKAIDYITDLKLRHGLNLRATNNSWGGGAYSQALAEAIERANKADILFVAAAGNDGSNNDRYASYPSGYTNSNVIAVASITSGGALSGFSNYGAKTVDIGAPGSAIYSTLPGANGTSSYGAYSGTSMATPHVTGAVALYAASVPSATGAQIKNAIFGNAVKTTSLNKKCVTGGRLNVSGF